MEQEDRSIIAANFATIISHLDPKGAGVNGGSVREGLYETPGRVAKFYLEFLNPKPFEFTMFEGEQYNGIVISRDIPFYSICEHHLAPFFGVAHVGYLPDKRIVGISKLARTVDLYARRLQNQERMMTQIAETLMEKLEPKGVAVVVKARHLCQEMRGIQKPGIETVTSTMLGVFRDDLNARNEFLKLLNI